jgi:hypothetical protein
MEIGSVTRFTAKGPVNFKAFQEKLKASGYIKLPFGAFGIRNVYLSPAILGSEIKKEEVLRSLSKIVDDLASEKNSTLNFSHILRRNGCRGFAIHIYESEGQKAMVILKAGDEFGDEFSSPHAGFSSSSLANNHRLVLPRRTND